MRISGIKRLNPLGTYTPNQFIIFMSKSTPFIIRKPDGNFEQSDEDFAIFFHEYWHYLHNITTISGFKSFAFSQHILAPFSKTVVNKGDGTSSGSNNLTSEEKTYLETMLKL